MKKLIAVVLIRSVQAVLSWFLAFGLMLGSPLGGNKALLAFAVAASFVVWFTGVLFDYVFLKERRSLIRSFILTFIGGGFGLIILFTTGLMGGFQGLAFPLIGALSSYHFSRK